MTKVTFFKRNGVYYGFRETGHSGYAETGSDIVCAALSAMTMLIVNTVEISYAADLEYKVDEKTADITVTIPSVLSQSKADEKKNFAISGLILGYFIQLMDMSEDYFDYLEVEEIEK